MTPLPLYVLAGGESSRFGEDKARARLGGMPLLVRVVAMLDPVASPATVVADVADKYADLGLRTIADRSPHLGPIGGLEAALVDRGMGHLLLAACDLVMARPDWVRQLQDAAGEEGMAAFRSNRGWEPLLAVYHSSAADAVQARLSGRDLSLQQLLDACGAAALDLPADWPEPNQINTRDDLRRAAGQPPI